MTGTAKRPDSRGQWTIKHADVGPEFQNLVRMAAERQGMTVGSFTVETLRERAQAILKGDAEGTPQRTPPARLEDVADALSGRMAEMVAELERRQAEALAAGLAEAGRRQDERLATMEREARRGRWRR